MPAPHTWIEKRMVNALLKDAKIGFLASKALGRAGRSGVGMAESLMGGMWVGGTAYLTEQTIEFWPNTLNKMMHGGSVDGSVIPLGQVTALNLRQGLGTKILDISTDAAMLSVRGYNMPDFVDAIRARLPG